MIEFYFIVFLAISCLVAAGVLSLRAAKDEQRSKDSLRHLQKVLSRAQFPGVAEAPPPPQKDWVPETIESWLLRAGYVPTKRHYVLFSLPAPVIAGLAGFLFGFPGVLAGLLVVYPLLLTLFLGWRKERFHDQVVALLPDFLDTIARVLSVGASIELAFRNASAECDEPLRGIAAQMLVRTKAGLALEDAMGQVAEIYDIKELGFVASVFYMGIRYGGNTRAILERMAAAIRERERSQRELHAMSSETRISAWILSALPILLGLLMLFNNPRYLQSFWRDPQGHQILLAAFTLQVIGMWLLFRLAKLRYR